MKNSFRIFWIIIDSLIFEPLYALFFSHSSSAVPITLSGIAVVVAAIFKNDIFYPGAVFLFLFSLIVYMVASVWFPDPFVLLSYRIVELGWIGFFAPAALSIYLIAIGRIRFSSQLLFLALCTYLVSALIRIFTRIRQADESEESDVPRRRREDFIRDSAESASGIDIFPGMFRGLTAVEARKRFNALAKRCHPDNGGDPALMQVLNDEYRKYKKRII